MIPTHEKIERKIKQKNQDETYEKMKKRAILMSHKKTKMNIFHKIQNLVRLSESSQDLLKSILHFCDIILNEKNPILTETQIYGQRKNSLNHLITNYLSE